jgi:hypothetical protein
VAGLSDLKKVQDYAKKHNLKFPTIALKPDVAQRAFSVFKDDNDPETPVVIYMPRVRDDQLFTRCEDDETVRATITKLKDFDIERCIAQEYCSTFNFVYEPEQARMLSDLAEFNMLAAGQAIVEAVKGVMKAKSVHTKSG